MGKMNTIPYYKTTLVVEQSFSLFPTAGSPAGTRLNIGKCSSWQDPTIEYEYVGLSGSFSVEK